jgi:hypothetical protein
VIGPIVAAIGKLYDVERKAKKQVEKMGLEGQEAIAVYTQLRNEYSRPQLAIIQELLQPASDQYPKGTDQRKGIDFLIKNWTSFTVYVDGGELPVDNVYASWCTFDGGLLWDLAA